MMRCHAYQRISDSCLQVACCADSLIVSVNAPAVIHACSLSCCTLEYSRSRKQCMLCLKCSTVGDLNAHMVGPHDRLAYPADRCCTCRYAHWIECCCYHDQSERVTSRLCIVLILPNVSEVRCNKWTRASVRLSSLWCSMTCICPSRSCFTHILVVATQHCWAVPRVICQRLTNGSLHLIRLCADHSNSFGI